MSAYYKSYSFFRILQAVPVCPHITSCICMALFVPILQTVFVSLYVYPHITGCICFSMSVRILQVASLCLCPHITGCICMSLRILQVASLCLCLHITGCICMSLCLSAYYSLHLYISTSVRILQIVSVGISSSVRILQVVSVYLCPSSCYRLYPYFFACILTNYMEQSPSWEANSSSATQDIPRILRNTKVYHRILCPHITGCIYMSLPTHILGVLSAYYRLHLYVCTYITGCNRMSIRILQVVSVSLCPHITGCIHTSVHILQVLLYNLHDPIMYFRILQVLSRVSAHFRLCRSIRALITTILNKTRNVQHRQCTYNVTLRRVHETTVAVEKQ